MNFSSGLMNPLFSKCKHTKYKINAEPLKSRSFILVFLKKKLPRSNND